MILICKDGSTPPNAKNFTSILNTAQKYYCDKVTEHFGYLPSQNDKWFYMDIARLLGKPYMDYAKELVEKIISNT